MPDRLAHLRPRAAAEQERHDAELRRIRRLVSAVQRECPHETTGEKRYPAGTATVCLDCGAEAAPWREGRWETRPGMLEE